MAAAMNRFGYLLMLCSVGSCSSGIQDVKDFEREIIVEVKAQRMDDTQLEFLTPNGTKAAITCLFRDGKHACTRNSEVMKELNINCSMTVTTEEPDKEIFHLHVLLQCQKAEHDHLIRYQMICEFWRNETLMRKFVGPFTVNVTDIPGNSTFPAQKTTIAAVTPTSTAQKTTIAAVSPTSTELLVGILVPSFSIIGLCMLYCLCRKKATGEWPFPSMFRRV